MMLFISRSDMTSALRKCKLLENQISIIYTSFLISQNPPISASVVTFRHKLLDNNMKALCPNHGFQPLQQRRCVTRTAIKTNVRKRSVHTYLPDISGQVLLAIAAYSDPSGRPVHTKHIAHSLPHTQQRERPGKAPRRLLPLSYQGRYALRCPSPALPIAFDQEAVSNSYLSPWAEATRDSESYAHKSLHS